MRICWFPTAKFWSFEICSYRMKRNRLAVCSVTLLVAQWWMTGANEIVSTVWVVSSSTSVKQWKHSCQNSHVNLVYVGLSHTKRKSRELSFLPVGFQTCLQWLNFACLSFKESTSNGAARERGSLWSRLLRAGQRRGVVSRMGIGSLWIQEWQSSSIYESGGNAVTIGILSCCWEAAPPARFTLAADHWSKER